MRLPFFCFVMAAVAALIGMTMGITMGMTHDFTLAPAHAHLNLLGWVTMSLYGLYHRGVVRERQRLAWTQVSAGAAGFPLMAGGLAFYLGMGIENAVPLVIVGSILSLLSMLLFLVVLMVDFRRSGARNPVAVARSQVGQASALARLRAM